MYRVLDEADSDKHTDLKSGHAILRDVCHDRRADLDNKMQRKETQVLSLASTIEVAIEKKVKNDETVRATVELMLYRIGRLEDLAKQLEEAV